MFGKLKGGDSKKKEMAPDEYLEVKGYMYDYKKLLFCEHEVATAVLEIQRHFELSFSCLDSHLEDVETDTRVLVGEVEYVKDVMQMMEHTLAENFNGIQNYLGNMWNFLAGMVQENENRLVT